MNTAGLTRPGRDRGVGRKEVYRYDDYRAFLRDKFEEAKANRPALSYRKFAAAAGIANPGYLNDVIKGRRRLSPAAAGKVAKGLGLTAGEAGFLKLLVTHERTGNVEERNALARRIGFRRGRSRFGRQNPDLAMYYSDWRYPLIRAAVTASAFAGDYAALAQCFDPPIPASILKKRMRDLRDWGLVSQGPDGKYTVTRKQVDPSPTLVTTIRDLNRQWILHAADAAVRLPSDQRHASTVLVALSDTARQKIGMELERFRSRVWALVDQDEEPKNSVMQLSTQYFTRFGPAKEPRAAVGTGGQ
jgi:uncharacterized protein (TIGR02147 family)